MSAYSSTNRARTAPLARTAGKETENGLMAWGTPFLHHLRMKSTEDCGAFWNVHGSTVSGVRKTRETVTASGDDPTNGNIIF